MRILFIIAIFLFIGALFIISNENLHLKEKEEARRFANLYYDWLFGIAENVGSFTMSAIKSEWLPDFNKSIE